MYSLGGAIDAQRGWGRADETWRVGAELAAYGVEPSWFGLGDLDLATHLVRSQMLEAGYPLSEVTEALCSRWLAELPGVRLRPMSDDRVETHVVVADPAAASGRSTMHFQEYWVRHRAAPEALQVMQVGIEQARPAPGVLDAFASADLILIAPSNPVVSIGPVAAVPGVREAIATAAAPVIGFSPILGGAPVLGMAHRLLPLIGVEIDAAAVGLHYGARAAGGLLDAWVMHTLRRRRGRLGPRRRDRLWQHRSDHARPGSDRQSSSGSASNWPAMITIFAPDGIGEVTPETDLAAIVHAAIAGRTGGTAAAGRHRGDHVQDHQQGREPVRGRPSDRLAVIDAETVRTVARRKTMAIVETPSGLTQAAAGVDNSNVASDSILLLPVDADASAEGRAEVG